MSEPTESPNFSAHLFELHSQMQAAMRYEAQSPLPSPDTTGQLEDEALTTLFEIVSYVGESWQIGAYSKLDEESFRHYMDLKTRDRPSYYTVYKMAIALFQVLVDHLGGPAAALAYLYTPDPPSAPANFSTVRAWVVQEFLKLYVANGAFRAYGWVNYPGFVGGPYNDPRHLPYRPYKP